MRDMMGLMKQAQAIQQKMAQIQSEMENTLVEGSAGGGLVAVSMTAKGDIRGVKIDPSILKPDEAEIVEDLILAACSDAKAKAERTMQERMAELTRGMPLPPGMKHF